eukprot:CAMPEP_0194129478 /NCGR_PEP_ID=MMETSP0152-20130528/685_1 /TAXON_ID=1049557 /ORGANISM="Thalassiothrix antarctica, Strain L6-D1" /LENGTH=51 /DNA_ID=CAMNT_0038823671 /DNA_START=64 /DNA_END=216 /DNA_ORIENTATION=-
MANEEHNTQCQPSMMSNITPPTRIIDYTAVDIVIRDNDDILGAILSFLDVI